jgi:hypothetical protein
MTRQRLAAFKRRQQIYFYLLDYWFKYGTTPNTAQIATRIRMSQDAVYQYLKQLEAAGWVRFNRYATCPIAITGLPNDTHKSLHGVRPKGQSNNANV